MNHLTFEEGLEETVNQIILIDKKPVLVGVYGWGNAGKSTFIDHLKTELAKQDLLCVGGGSQPREDSFRIVAEYLDDPRQSKAIAYHCGWERSQFSPQSIDSMAAKFGLSIDINVFLYAPSHTMGIIGDYDRIIRNQYAQ